MFLLIILFFILGSAVGSFLNVLIDRGYKKQSILGRSYCDYCKATLKTLDLVPIISFVGLGAKCRYCKKPVSWQYPAVEALSGVLFVLAFWVLTQSANLNFVTLIFWFILIATVIVVGVFDFKFYLVPTTYVFAASLLALFYNYFFLNSPQFIEHVISAFVSALFFLVIVVGTRGKGMGEGDIFLGFLMGMVLGAKSGFLAIFLAFLTGAVIAIILVLFGRKKFGQVIPFAPFLVFGFLISLFWGNTLFDWYLMLY